ncbi:MAG: glycosyltransferase family 9 protein [Sedimentisphaerales bacterium]|nr:glycosyltransferase family 9 protein [Sedimentisphaerales bacterium]
MLTRFQNILIIKPSSLGDIVSALPALSALRKSCPDARISWLIRPEFAGLLKNHPFLTQIILFDRKLLAKAWYNPRAFRALLSLISELRQNQFDAVIDLQGLFRTAVLAWLSKCKNRFGTADAREFAHLFYTKKIPKDENCVHIIDYQLKVVEAAGSNTKNVGFVLPIVPTESDSLNRLLADHNITSNSYAVLIPGSAHKSKCWPLENFAILAARIYSQFGLSIVATGTKTENLLVEKINNLTDTPIVNFAGLTTLEELVVLLKNAKVVVSNDTGPGHIAAALGTPLVMIFGCSNPARLAPCKRFDCVVAKDPFDRGPDIKSKNPRYDIRAISANEVYNKVCEQIEKTSLPA